VEREINLAMAPGLGGIRLKAMIDNDIAHADAGPMFLRAQMPQWSAAGHFSQSVSQIHNNNKPTATLSYIDLTRASKKR
jgi:hypothetical protein